MIDWKLVWKWIGGIAAVWIAIWALCFIVAEISSRWTPQGGEIGVVRSGPATSWIGAWYNGHNIKSVIPPGSGNQGIGLGSTVHAYPASTVQRQYTITDDPNAGDQAGNDYVQVPTKDGIEVRLDGTFFFTTGFDGTKAGEQLVKDFDNRFGVRTFNPDAQSSSQLHAYDGNNGWSAWLNTVVRPIINNDLRVEIGKYSCAELVSSCALVYNTNTAVVQNGQSNQTLSQIQSDINSSLETDVKSTLGEDYFCAQRDAQGTCAPNSGVQFRLAKVTLPDQVENEIEKAQSQFAAVGTARAQVQQAQLQAKANEERQRGYVHCPACAQIDELKSIPSTVTVYAPGGNTAVPLTK